VRVEVVCALFARTRLGLSAPVASPQREQVLLGDMGAGKSSLVLRFVKGQFFDFQARAPPRHARR
jgi:GTPase SAR1 family protein